MTPTDAIRARRAMSNIAIAERDLDAIAATMCADVTVAVAGGPTLKGRDASRAAFAEQFADKGFRGYVREPDEVVADDATPVTHATERGRWTGRWQQGWRTETMRGTYEARWRLEQGEWRIASEVFVGE